MPQLRISTVEEAADLAWGLAFLGTGGGGGRVQDALDMLVTAMEKGATAAFVETSELPGNAWIAAVASVGGREPDLGPRPEELAQYGLVQERFSYIDRMVRALEALQDHAGTRLGAVVSFELGTSTVAALVAASRLGLPCVNGDYAGRAVPEPSQTKAEIFGLRVHPAVLADRWGSLVILKEAPSAAMVDRVGRMLSVAAYGGGVGLAGYLYQLHEAARALVPNSIGRAAEPAAGCYKLEPTRTVQDCSSRGLLRPYR